MVNYTWEQFTPFTLGLDETLSRLETFAGSGTNYPPYNIYNGSDSRTILEVALAGFSKEELSVTTERNCLTVSAKKTKEKSMDVKKHLKFLKEVKSHLKRHRKLPSQPYKKTNQKFKKGVT